jgi:hypothetical protein
MTFQYINTGTGANKGDGDSLIVAFQKINSNFSQIDLPDSSVAIKDENGVAQVDLKAFTGEFNIPVDTETLVELFSFDKQEYRSASIAIFASDSVTNSRDSGTGYFVNWNGNNAVVAGVGILSLLPNGTTNNANWDLSNVVITGDTLTVMAKNMSGTTASNIIQWKAKVNLFRL